MIAAKPSTALGNGGFVGSSSSKHEYYVVFPAGAMGLELEPVIKSSEREIGCRVKDFYYGVDYNGIEPRRLEGLVAIGDIICSLDDVNVRSMPFPEIVDMIRSKRHCQRRVLFKNMAFSWNGQPEKLASPHAKKKEATKRFFDENIINGASIDGISPIKSVSKSSKSPKAFQSPSQTKRAAPLTPKQNKSKPSLMVDAPSEIQGMKSPVTPSAIKYLSQHGVPVSQSDAANEQQELSVIEPTHENHLRGVGAALGKKAAELAIIATRSLGNQAQTALNHAATVVPKYSEQEMELVVAKKNELLAELTQNVLLLRQEEEKRLRLQKEVEMIDQLTQQNVSLLETVSNKDAVIDDMDLRIKTLETEITILRTETKQDQQAMKANKLLFEQSKAQNAELSTLVQALQFEKRTMAEDHSHLAKKLEQLEKKSSARERSLLEDLSALQEQLRVHQQEKAAEISSLKAQLVSNQEQREQEKDDLGTEIASLAKEKVRLQAELSKVQLGSDQSLQSLRELLVSRENDVQSTNLQMTTMRGQLTNAEMELAQVQRELGHCSEQLLKEQAAQLEQLAAMQVLREQLIQTEKDNAQLSADLKALLEEKTSATETIQDLQREHTYLSDKVRLLQLTVDAQSSEISTVAKELSTAEQRYEAISKQRADEHRSFQQYTLQIRSSCDAFVEEFALLKKQTAVSLDANATMIADLSAQLLAKSTVADAQLLSANQSISKLEERVGGLQNSEHVLLQEVKRLTQAAEESVVKYQEDILAVQTQFTTAQKLLIEAEENRDALQTSFQQLQNQQRQSSLESAAREEDMASLRRQIVAYEQLVQSLKESARDEIHSQKEQLENTIEIYIGQLKKHDVDMMQLSAQHRTLQEEYARCLKDLRAQEEELPHWKSRVTDLEADLQEKLAEYQHSRESLEAYHLSQASAFEAQIEQLSSSLCSAEDETQRVKTHVARVESDLFDALASLQVSNAEIEELKTQVLVREESLQSQCEEVQQLQNALKQLSQELALEKNERSVAGRSKDEEVHRLESRCASLEQANRLADAEKKALVNEVSELHRTVSDMESRFKTSRAQVQQVCAKIGATALLELNLLKKSFAELRSEVTCLASIHHNISKAMETRTNSLAKELSDRKHSIAAVTTQATMHAALSKEKEAFFQRAMAAETRCQELEVKLFSQLSDLMQLNQQIEAARSHEEQLRDASIGFEKSLESKDDEIASLQAQLSDVLEEKKVLRLEIGDLKVSSLAARRELEQVQQQKDRAVEEAQLLKAELHASEHKTQLLEDQMRALKERVMQYQQLELSDLDHSLLKEDAVVEELAMVEKAILTSKHQESELRKVVRESEDIINLLQTQLKETQQSIDHKDAKALQLEKTLASMERSHSQLQTERQKLLSDLAVLRSELAASNESSLLETNQRHQVNEELQSIVARNTELAADVAALKQIVEISQQELREEKKRSAALASKLTSEESHGLEVQQRVRQLDDAMVTATETIAALEANVAQMTAEKASLEAKLSDKRAENVELVQSYEEAQVRLKAVTQELAEAQSSVAASAMLLKQLRASNESLETSLTAAEKTVASSEEVVSKQKATISSLQEDLHSALSERSDHKAQLSLVHSALEAEATSLRRALDDAEQRLVSKEADFLLVAAELDAKKAVATSTQTQLHEAQNQMREHVQRISTLREVISTLEGALSLAEQREEEHAEVVRGWEEQCRQEREAHALLVQQQCVEVKRKLLEHRGQYEAQLEICRREIAEQKKVAHVNSQALDAKTKELDALHRHIRELLKNTTSPVKVARPLREIPLSEIENEVESALDDVADKENADVVGSETSLIAAATKEVEVWYTAEGAWHEQLLTLSLNLHEVLSFVFFKLQQQPQVHTAETQQLWITVSQLQQKMHEVLARPPWMNYLDPVQSLTPAHERFSLLSAAPVVSSATVKIPALCKVVVQLLLQVVRRYKTRAADLQDQLAASMITISTMRTSIPSSDVDEEVLRRSASSDHIAERIDRWMKTVETYENSQHNNSKTHSAAAVLSSASCKSKDASGSISFYERLVAVADAEDDSHISARRMETQDMASASLDWQRSPTRSTSHPPVTTRSAQRKLLESPGHDISHNSGQLHMLSLLADDSVLSEVWDISTDISHVSSSTSALLDFETQNLSFSNLPASSTEADETK